MNVDMVITIISINTPKTKSTAVVRCVPLKPEKKVVASTKVCIPLLITKSPTLENSKD
jgi:hypothetical protein